MLQANITPDCPTFKLYFDHNFKHCETEFLKNKNFKIKQLEA